ncbi:MAG: serine/threonine-protein kinase [Planctomycetota bacterium]|nr:serine/threonine-protein kinase [Planctomycetota bacterium]
MTSLAPPGFAADQPHVRVHHATDDSTQSVAAPQLQPALPVVYPQASGDGAAPAGNGGEATVISQSPQGNSAAVAANVEQPQAEGRPLHTGVADVGRALEGKRLGVYELEKFVGGGGMGAVFRGRDTTLDRTVAVKVLFQHRTDDADLLRRFKNEAQSAARLDHENIGRVYAVGSEEGWHYIVFEFIEGVNLRDLVQDTGPFDVARTITITSQLADALAHAETRNVVHRDIKPSNVIITPAGRARLVDMGLARLHQMTGDRDLTVSGMTLGTFDYISPEQARDPRLADVRSDLYSLGCTAYFMLIGRPPFAEGTMVQKLLQHQQQQATPVDRIRQDIPWQLAQVIGRLMEKDPADRYQHPAELVAALAAVAAERGIELPLTSSGPAPRRRRRSLRLADHVPWLVPLLAFAAIVVALKYSAGRAEREERRRASADPVGLTAAGERPTEMTGTLHRVVDAPNAASEGWTEHVSLAEAVAAASDGDRIELAFSAVRDEPPIAIAGKRLTIRAAEGFRPEVRFSGFAMESLARERAGVVCDAAGITFENLTLTLAMASESPEPAAKLFLLRGGSQLALLRCRVGIEGVAGSLVESTRPRCIEVLAAAAAVDTNSELDRETPAPSAGKPAGASSTRIDLIDTVVRGDMNFLEVAGERRVDLNWSGGSLATNGRGLVVEGAARDVENGTLLAATLRQGIFACRAGFACLLDSPARPTEPRLEVTATGCRFLTPEGVPLIEQSGIEDPEVYRGRVRWTDAGSRYEGSPIFRRIDGAAERVEIDFSALAQPLQFVPQIDQWPSDDASNDAEAAVAPAGEATGASESSPPGRLPEESSQTP